MGAREDGRSGHGHLRSVEVAVATCGGHVVKHNEKTAPGWACWLAGTGVVVAASLVEPTRAAARRIRERLES